MKIGLVVVGLGGISLEYDLQYTLSKVGNRESHVKSILDDDSFLLLAGVDLNGVSRQNLTRNFGIPAYPTLKSIPSDILSKTDAFIVATPTSTHFQILNEIAGVKADPWILCEKPMGNSLGAALKISDVLDTHKILVNYTRRFSDDIKWCEKMFKSFLDGGNRNAPQITCEVFGGSLRTGSHFIDLLNSWFPNNFSEIKFEKLYSKPDNAFKILMKFDGQQVLYIDVNPNSDESYGILKVEDGEQSISYIRDQLIVRQNSNEEKYQVHASQSQTLQAFKTLIATEGTSNNSSYENAVKVHRILDSISTL
jgi:predicted dehydrogenase